MSLLMSQQIALDGPQHNLSSFFTFSGKPDNNATIYGTTLHETLQQIFCSSSICKCKNSCGVVQQDIHVILCNGALTWEQFKWC